jgi:hypothetical protein
LGIWISSDTLFPVNVFTDVVWDRYPLSGWHFSIAPCWFPDLIASWIFVAITQNVILATLLAGFIQIALMIGAFALIRRAIAVSSPALQEVILLGIGAAVTLFVAAHTGLYYPDLYRFFLPQSHIGSLLVVVYGLGLALLMLRQSHEEAGVSRKIFFVYCVLCLLGGMSNLLFFAHMLMPLSVSVLFAVFFTMFTLEKCWAILIGWPFALLGALLNKVLFNTTDASAQAGITYERVLLSLDVFARGAAQKLLAHDWLHVSAVLWCLTCIVFVLFVLRRFAVSGGRESGLPERIMAVFLFTCLLSSVAAVAAIVLGGSNGLAVFKDYIWSMHYLQPTFLLPIFGIPFVFSWGLQKILPDRVVRVTALVLAINVFGISAFSLAVTPRPIKPIHAYVPPLVEFIDILAAQEGLKCGIAGYWQARLVTLLSKQGVRAYAVDGSLQPLLWVSNERWYVQANEDRTKRPTIDFVILDDPFWKISRESVIQTLGIPKREVVFLGTRVLVYKSKQ